MSSLPSQSQSLTSNTICSSLAKDSKSPITLLELGLHKDDNIIVCCPEGFYRKGNVDIVCKKYNIKTCKTLNELVIQIINELK